MVPAVERALESMAVMVVGQEQLTPVPVGKTFMLKLVRVDHMQLVALMVVVDILMVLLAAVAGLPLFLSMDHTLLAAVEVARLTVETLMVMVATAVAAEAAMVVA
jgi:hypothetical protein